MQLDEEENKKPERKRDKKTRNKRECSKERQSERSAKSFTCVNRCKRAR